MNSKSDNDKAHTILISQQNFQKWIWNLMASIKLYVNFELVTQDWVQYSEPYVLCVCM